MTTLIDDDNVSFLFFLLDLDMSMRVSIFRQIRFLSSHAHVGKYRPALAVGKGEGRCME